MITAPQQTAADYGVVSDDPDATPKHGTSVQSGWDNLAVFERKASDFPVDFKMSEETQLVAFLEEGPFHSYHQFWLEGKDGKKSYVALGDDDPLAVIAGSVPRPKVSFNVLNLSTTPPETQILTAALKLAELLQHIHLDERRGPLNRSLWAITRRGTGTLTQYDVDRVRFDELDGWGLTEDMVRQHMESAKRYTPADIYVASYEEHERIARELVSR